MVKYDYQDIPSEGEIPLKVIILIIVAAIAAILAVASVLSFPPSQEEMIDSLYNEGNRWIQNGNFTLAINTYSKIIEMAPNEEQAWHEKGKLLNRFEMCDEAKSHYEKYVENFPDSSRAQEGYEIAKNC